MVRYFSQILRNWNDQGAKKPLLVTGARQTGKTYLIEEFLRETYEDSFIVNLERQSEYLSVFEGDLKPELILKRMEQLSGRRITDRTAIFFDEIQQSERAITSLKYFCESDRPYQIIGAGSLLGVKLARFGSSFPVGKVQIRYLYPMSFFEFLLACGEEPLLEGIWDHYRSREKMPDGIHNKAMELYREYLLVGGMPEAVRNYAEAGKDSAYIDHEYYEDLLTAYTADMTRYTISPAEGVKITETYRSVPRQLARENPKFRYNDIRPYANKRDFSSALDWLEASGMVVPVKKLKDVQTPLSAYEADSGSKIYLSDVGLLTHLSRLSARDIQSGTQNTFKGAVTENFVIRQLTSPGKELYYYKPSESMEIDLVLDTAEGVVPVEIKSGRHKRSVSLENYRAKYHPDLSIRLSELNYGYTDGLYALPLYAAGCIQDLYNGASCETGSQVTSLGNN